MVVIWIVTRSNEHSLFFDDFNKTTHSVNINEPDPL